MTWNQSKHAQPKPPKTTSKNCKTIQNFKIGEIWNFLLVFIFQISDLNARIWVFWVKKYQPSNPNKILLVHCFKYADFTLVFGISKQRKAQITNFFIASMMHFAICCFANSTSASASALPNFETVITIKTQRVLGLDSLLRYFPDILWLYHCNFKISITYSLCKYRQTEANQSLVKYLGYNSTIKLCLGYLTGSWMYLC